PDADCDAVTHLICDTLVVDLSNPKSWYPKHQLLQGLMLQLYQDEALSKVRENISVRKVFSDLYESNNIIANCEKVSYNPPENKFFKFMGSPLHWDIDFSIGPRYHIQGLIYLDDVPVERGALTLIPGFHHRLSDFLRNFDTPDEAIATLRQTKKIVPLAGKKGDLIVWLESIPHAASPNQSTVPRFVQYVSFTCH
ncbi:MAG: phytanoyl-CoA dioxygenase, partial [Chryseobacterium sp.]